MTGRIGLIVVGVLVAIFAVYFVVSAIIGMLMWVAVFGVMAAAVVGAIKITRWSNGAVEGKTQTTRSHRPKGMVDCTGRPLSPGDGVQTGAGFDGSLELAVSPGRVVKIRHGKAYVRFDADPENLHAVQPTALRRTS
jgi:hypothetical protein